MCQLWGWGKDNKVDMLGERGVEQGEFQGRRDLISPEGGGPESTLHPTIITGLWLETEPQRRHANRTPRLGNVLPCPH